MTLPLIPVKNTLFIEANPNNDQPEQYHPNNLAYIPFRVDVDKLNPTLDVTFDGIHILDKDVVSAKPFIKIALRDENQYRILDDTSLMSVTIRYPESNTDVNIPFDGITCKFIPATSGGSGNVASIEYRPTFVTDGIYELSVKGRDKNGNMAGTPQSPSTTQNSYRISFDVINKSTISSVLNYPNPFSTSTAFVFMLTGSNIPTQFKIQIMTVTGKVVKEITKQEIGQLHIGRNITDYKWDGRDMYGQPLANGVYMYRVVTAIDGQNIEHRSTMSGDDTNGGGSDKFFKGGWGKMYIMR